MLVAFYGIGSNLTDISPGTPDQMAVTMKSLCSAVRSFQLSAFHIGSKSATSSNGTSQPVKSWQSISSVIKSWPSPQKRKKTHPRSAAASWTMEKYARNLSSIVGSLGLNPVMTDRAPVAFIVPTALHDSNKVSVCINYNKVIPLETECARAYSPPPFSHIYGIGIIDD